MTCGDTDADADRNNSVFYYIACDYEAWLVRILKRTGFMSYTYFRRN